MITNLKPIGGNIIIKPLEQERVTASGLVIPDNVEGEKPEQGTVIAVGRSVENIKVGDSVLFTKYRPVQIEYNDEKLLIATEDDLLAIIQ